MTIHKYIRHNFRITGLHAALGLGQLSNFQKKKGEKNTKTIHIFFSEK